MRSSTSSSETRRPKLPWGRLWCLAVLLFAGGAVGLELFWRDRGFIPTIVDDADLWSQARRRANEPGALVLIGASRIQLGLSTAVLEARFPGRPIAQLAIDGSSYAPVLRDLAEDPEFQGSVVASFQIGVDFHGSVPLKYVAHWHRAWNPARAMERKLATWVQGNVVALQPELAATALLRSLGRGGGLPLGPSYLRTFADRSRLANYRDMEPSRLDAERTRRLEDQARALSQPAQAAGELAEVERLADIIRARGGSVVFVLMPYGTQHVDGHGPSSAERSADPLHDAFLAYAATSRSCCIDGLREPTLRDFKPADGSHLDERDAGPFTDRLVDVLLAGGCLSPPP